MIKLSLFLISLLISSYHCIYFTIDHHQRCLYEEVTKDTLFKLDFQLMESIPPETLADPTSVNSHGVRVMIFNPVDKAILYKLALPNQPGKLSFFSEEDGEYRICFELTADISKKLKFLINLNVGDDEFSDDKKPDVKTQIAILNEKVKKFSHHVKQFREMQKMNKNSEQIVFDAQEGLNLKINIGIVFQFIVIIASGIFQIFTLRRFLIKKKLY